MESTYAIYALLAVAIPFIVQQLKKFNFIPQRFVPLLPPILGFVGVLFTQLATGVGWVIAMTAALGVEGIATAGAATMGRQIYAKSIKKG